MCFAKFGARHRNGRALSTSYWILEGEDVESAAAGSVEEKTPVRGPLINGFARAWMRQLHRVCAVAQILHIDTGAIQSAKGEIFAVGRPGRRPRASRHEAEARLDAVRQIENPDLESQAALARAAICQPRAIRRKRHAVVLPGLSDPSKQAPFAILPRKLRHCCSAASPCQPTGGRNREKRARQSGSDVLRDRHGFPRYFPA